MADTKITALTAIGANPINVATFPIPMVDLLDNSMAASGTTKKVTVNQILGAGGTATLASATITGDLTVDTSTLKVDSANDRVGIGTATPGGALEVFKNTNGQNRLFLNNPSTGASAYDAIDFTAGTANNQILSMGSGYSGSFPYLTGALLLRSAQANGIVLNTAGSAAAIQFGINDTLAMTLNSTGLGVGTSPNAKLTVYGGGATTSTVNFSGGSAGSDNATIASNYNLNFQVDANNTIGGRAFIWRYGGKGYSDGTHLMTLDASGNLFLGAATATAQGRQEITYDGSTLQGLNVIDSSATATATAVSFIKSSGTRGNILVTATGTTYNTVSDYRLKESVKPLVGGLARVSALKPSIYKWKIDGSNGEGFLAHELAEVVPAAVTGEKDAVNDDGSIKPQGVDLSKVVPVLVAAIQELAARVQTLETR